MCEFFSCVSDGNGNVPHFNADVFKDIFGIDVRKKGRKP